MNKTVNNRVIPIRPFVLQKALFCFIGIVFIGLMSVENTVQANSGLQVERSACSIDSIRNKQRSYNIESLNKKGTRLKSLNIEVQTGLLELPRLDFDLVSTTPHDVHAYTQGLVYYKGYLYESTGGLGLSELRKVELKTGKVIKFKKLPDSYFAEGLAVSNNHLVQLTLKKNVALVYDIGDFKEINQFSFTGDGWGIVESGSDLLISDGSSLLQRVDAGSFKLEQKVNVTVNGEELHGINEMENIDGMIYANVWPTDCIAVIDSDKYNVVAWLDLSSLYPENKRLNKSSVLNGIAYDVEKRQLLVTGKNWPYIYHLNLKQYPD